MGPTSTKHSKPPKQPAQQQQKPTTTTAATTTTTTAPSSNLVRKPILSEFVSLQITFIENKLLCKYKQIGQSEKGKNIKRKIRKQATLSPFLSLFPLRRSA